MSLIATLRSRRVSRAWYTSPIPPLPIREVISYTPTRRPIIGRAVCWDIPSAATCRAGSSMNPSALVS